jgi:hypothetical protein
MSCYLYCFTIRLLIVDNLSRREAFNRMMQESDRIARVSGFSTLKFWIENDVDVDD